MGRSRTLLFPILAVLLAGLGLWWLARPVTERATPVEAPAKDERASRHEPVDVAAHPAPDDRRRARAGAGAVNRELTVTFADGAPAAGVRVVVFRGATVLSTATTSGDGVARLFVPHEECEGAAFAAGAPVHRLPLTAETTSVRLPRGSVLAGRMTVDGAAPGEEVRLTLEDDDGWEPHDFLPAAVWEALGTSRHVEHETRTSPAGAFRFAGLPETWRWAVLRPHGGYHVLGSEDYARGPWPGTEPDVGVSRAVEDFHLACGRALRIRGRVVHGATGAPVARGRARLGGEYPDGTGGRSTSRHLGDDARFEFALQRPVRADLTSLTFASPQGAGEVEILLDTARPDAQGLWDLGDVPLAPYAPRRFLVRDAGGRPVPGAIAEVPADEDGLSPLSRRTSKPGDDTGRIDLEVEARVGAVRILAPHFETATVPLGAATSAPIVVTLHGATELVVDVDRGDGPLPAGLRIRVSCRLPLFPLDGDWSPPFGGVTYGGGASIGVSVGPDGGALRLAADDEGRLGLSGLRAGEPLGVAVVGPCGYEVLGRAIPALHEGEHRVIELDATGLLRTVRGTVFGPDGKPVAGAAIRVRLDDDDRHVARTAADGTFTAAGFLPDEIELLAVADGFAPTSTRHRPQPPPGAALVLYLASGR